MSHLCERRNHRRGRSARSLFLGFHEGCCFLRYDDDNRLVPLLLLSNLLVRARTNPNLMMMLVFRWSGYHSSIRFVVRLSPDQLLSILLMSDYEILSTVVRFESETCQRKYLLHFRYDLYLIISLLQNKWII